MNHHDYDKTIFCPLQTNTVFSRNDLNKRFFLAMRTLYQRSQGSPSSYNLRHREPGATLDKNCGSFTFGAAKCCFTTDERGYQPWGAESPAGRNLPCCPTGKNLYSENLLADFYTIFFPGFLPLHFTYFFLGILFSEIIYEFPNFTRSKAFFAGLGIRSFAHFAQIK